MAVLGQGEAGWRDPESYPPILSRVIKQIIQTWVRKDQSAEWVLASADDQLGEINKGYSSDDPPSTPGPPSSPPSSIHSDDPLPAVHIRRSRRPFQEQLTWMMHQFMIHGTHSPMETLLDWRTYGSKVHYNHTAPGHVTWIGEDQLLYQQMAFTMGDFQGFIHGLVTAAREILGHLCMQDHAQMPPLPWTALYDDPSQSQAGWNFVQDARTRWPVDGTHWMINQLRAEPAMQRHFMQGGQFHPSAIQQY
ncbi:hypothetical protein KXV22_006732 [Aspergillus fumigatus]|nr:hypothetical protein KXX09_006171 [Aspergillus fumigatus]KAH3543233.1 hypothetical protein KXW20_009498 [Aspergillus fumigatus]KAH3565491.1 hypothetical protein KXV22_006732 [Aspergillus fumigatus]